MGVTMKGGTSGNREDALPKVSVPFDRQTMENTARAKSVNPDVTWAFMSGNRHIPVDDEHPPMPEGGSPNDAAV